MRKYSPACLLRSRLCSLVALRHLLKTKSRPRLRKPLIRANRLTFRECGCWTTHRPLRCHIGFMSSTSRSLP